jgi:hypothetical protein
MFQFGFLQRPIPGCSMQAGKKQKFLFLLRLTAFFDEFGKDAWERSSNQSWELKTNTRKIIVRRVVTGFRFFTT